MMSSTADISGSLIEVRPGLEKEGDLCLTERGGR